MGVQLLLADCGNQRLKLAAESLQEVSTFRWREPSERERLFGFLKQQKIRCVRLASSSAEGSAAIRTMGLQDVGVHQVTPEDVPLCIQTTGTGVDRLLAAWYAYQMTDHAVLVADCGTAFTLDCVDASGNFLGGAIGAGLGTQEAALQQACPHLDLPGESQRGIPADTASAVEAGTRRAFAYALSGLADDFLTHANLTQANAVRCFLTGGDAERIASLLPSWEREEHMVLKALAALPS